jgi:transposase
MFRSYVMPVPDAVKKLKPTGLGPCEVRAIKGHYYVYSVTSKWDPAKGRSKKITGPCMGKITVQDGFIRSKKYKAIPKTLVVREYGVYTMLEQLNRDLYERLREYFPDTFREIFTIAMLRIVHRCTGSTLKKFYDSSVLCTEHPELALSANSVTAFMSYLGEQRGMMVEFMRSYVSDDTTLLFDGTNIFTSSSTASYARKGYNHGKRKTTQINLLYIFDGTSHMPVYYRMLPGNIVDKASLTASIRESGAHKGIIIGDKGFYSKKNTAFLDDGGFSYMLPLQSNTAYIDTSFTEDLDRKKYDGFFFYHNRVIWYKKNPVGNKGHYLYIFQDDHLKGLKESVYLAKVREDYQGYSQEQFFSKTRMGVIGFMSNLDELSEEIYLKYKARWEIEECFDYLKNSVQIGACYQHSNEHMEAWAFLNHISLLLFYNLNQKIISSGITGSYSAEDIIDICRNIYKVVLDDGQQIISEVAKPDRELLEKLDVSLPIT